MRPVQLRDPPHEKVDAERAMVVVEEPLVKCRPTPFNPRRTDADGPGPDHSWPDDASRNQHRSIRCAPGPGPRTAISHSARSADATPCFGSPRGGWRNSFTLQPSASRLSRRLAHGWVGLVAVIGFCPLSDSPQGLCLRLPCPRTGTSVASCQTPARSMCPGGPRSVLMQTQPRQSPSAPVCQLRPGSSSRQSMRATRSGLPPERFSRPQCGPLISPHRATATGQSHFKSGEP